MRRDGSRLVGGITLTATEIFLAERTLGGDSPERFDGRNMAHAKTCTSCRLWSTAASLCLEFWTRYESV
jgi:hypothetical protein